MKMTKSKSVFVAIAVGFFLAVAVILVGFFASALAGIKPITQFVWAPGMALVTFSNWLCPPFGAVCVFGINSQGNYNRWFLICLISFWWFAMSLVAGVMLAIAARLRGLPLTHADLKR
jgi:hypothetical protein